MQQNASKRIIPPEVLLEAYSQGIFPMSDSRDDDFFQWYSARRRGIIPLDQFRVSSNARRLIRNNRYKIRFDHDFRGVMERCADRETTWISDLIIESFCALHELGYAHSVEVYSRDEQPEMVGGLYGVSLRGAFFGESMFNTERETAKIALFYCHKALANGGFELWDTQFYTDHLGRFGAVEIGEDEYDRRLREAMKKEAAFRAVEADV